MTICVNFLISVDRLFFPKMERNVFGQSAVITQKCFSPI